MSWFSDLFGKGEPCSREEATLEAYEAARALFSLEEAPVDSKAGDVLIAPNGRRFQPGAFEAPRLSELRARAAVVMAEGGTADKADAEAKADGARPKDPLSFMSIFGDARELHTDPKVTGGVFQVASQFNCLEMVDKSVSPQAGITCYIFDKSQGPACARACAASTAWRNYCMPFGPEDPRGQREEQQLNCLSDVQALLGDGLLEVKNGYSSSPNVEALAAKLQAMSEEELDEVRAALRVGIQWTAEVTDEKITRKKNVVTGKWEEMGAACGPVTQLFASALFVKKDKELWRPLAQLVLEAAYEATLAAAVLNYREWGGTPNVFLTLLGGANFGNESDWIKQAVQRAIELYKNSGLKVFLVHFSPASPEVRTYAQFESELHKESAPQSKGKGKGKGKGK